jgi:hypothetical protein
MIDRDSAWGSPTFSHPDIVQGTMRTRKQTPLLTLKFHNEVRTLLALFDQFGGTGEQRRWHLKAERFGGSEID